MRHSSLSPAQYRVMLSEFNQALESLDDSLRSVQQPGGTTKRTQDRLNQALYLRSKLEDLHHDVSSQINLIMAHYQQLYRDISRRLTFSHRNNQTIVSKNISQLIAERDHLLHGFQGLRAKIERKSIRVSASCKRLQQQFDEQVRWTPDTHLRPGTKPSREDEQVALEEPESWWDWPKRAVVTDTDDALEVQFCPDCKCVMQAHEKICPTCGHS